MKCYLLGLREQGHTPALEGDNSLRVVIASGSHPGKLLTSVEVIESGEVGHNSSSSLAPSV